MEMHLRVRAIWSGRAGLAALNFLAKHTDFIKADIVLEMVSLFPQIPIYTQYFSFA